MALLSNNFDGGTDNANVTIANSGGTNGNAFSFLIIDNASTPGGTSAIQYKAAAARLGGMGCRITPTTNSTYLRWDVTGGTRMVVGRWVRTPSIPVSNYSVLTLRGSSAMASVVLTTGGEFRAQNAASALLASSAVAASAGAWYYVQLASTYGTTTSNGRIEMRVWDTSGSLILDYDSGATTNTGTTAGQQVRLAGMSTAAGIAYDDVDGAQVNTDLASGWLTVPMPPSNSAPTADAGSDQTDVEPFATVTLSGTGSTDSDGTITGYSWAQTGGTPTATLTGAATSTPTFEAPATIAGTTLTFTLTVTDDDGATDTDTVQVEVLPHTWFQIGAGSTLSPIRASIIT